MGDRKHIGVIFSYNENWVGGTYYLLNLISSFNSLTEISKPKVSIISYKKSDFEYVSKETGYPFLSFIKARSEHSLLAKAVNAFSLRLFHKKWFKPQLKDTFDLILPNPSDPYFGAVDDYKKVYWIPDFQDVHLPEFFSTDEHIKIKQRRIEQVYRAKKMILSSQDCLKDYVENYPQSKASVSVIPFSVTHPDFSEINFDTLANKYQIDRPYFYTPNQFWIHKNHRLLIEAVKEVVKTNPKILLLLSGKESDYRHSNYIQELKDLVEIFGLQSNIRFLGFLERKVQLCLFKNAVAVIQPSRFEGWSTVVEDAKVLRKFIIASNLNVHAEQLLTYKNSISFDPLNVESLIIAISQAETEVNTNPHFSYDYDRCRLKYANQIMQLIDN